MVKTIDFQSKGRRLMSQQDNVVVCFLGKDNFPRLKVFTQVYMIMGICEITCKKQFCASVCVRTHPIKCASGACDVSQSLLPLERLFGLYTLGCVCGCDNLPVAKGIKLLTTCFKVMGNGLQLATCLHSLKLKVSRFILSFLYFYHYFFCFFCSLMSEPSTRL